MLTILSNIRTTGYAVCVILCFYCLAGCTQQVGNCLIKDNDIVSKIIKNTTSKEEVKKLLGEPEDTQISGAREHWSYSCLEKKDSAAAVLLASPSLGSSSNFYMLTVFFENGKVSDISSSTRKQ